MGSESTESSSPRDAAPTALQQGFTYLKHAARTGLAFGRQHGPVVARKTADGLKRAGGAIRESEHAKKIATPARKAGRAAGRALTTSSRYKKAHSMVCSLRKGLWHRANLSWVSNPTVLCTVL